MVRLRHGGNGFKSGSGNDQIDIDHDGGDAVDTAQLSVNVEGTVVSSSSDTGSWNPPSGDFTAGTTITIDENTGSAGFQSGDELVLIYTTDGGSTAIPGESEVP